MKVQTLWLCLVGFAVAIDVLLTVFTFVHWGFFERQAWFACCIYLAMTLSGLVALGRFWPGKAPQPPPDGL